MVENRQPSLLSDQLEAVIDWIRHGHKENVDTGTLAQLAKQVSEAEKKEGKFFCLFPLHMACRVGNTEAAKQLLDLGFEPNQRDTLGATPLHYAAFYGKTDCVRLLLALEGGVDVDVKDGDGDTPLSFAAGNGHGEIARVLIASGADVNSAGNLFQKEHGWTPLHRAAEGDSPELVRMLIEAGGDPYKVNTDGDTPVDIAYKRGGNAEVRELLQEAMLRRRTGIRGVSEGRER